MLQRGRGKEVYYVNSGQETSDVNKTKRLIRVHTGTMIPLQGPNKEGEGRKEVCFVISEVSLLIQKKGR